MPFQEIEDALGVRHLGHVLVFQSHHLPIAFVDRLLALGFEDLVDLFLQGYSLRVGLGVIVAVDFLDQPLCPLQGVENALVMYRLGKDSADGFVVVLIHIRDPVLGRTGQVR